MLFNFIAEHRPSFFSSFIEKLLTLHNYNKNNTKHFFFKSTFYIYIYIFVYI